MINIETHGFTAVVLGTIIFCDMTLQKIAGSIYFLHPATMGGTPGDHSPTG